MEHTSVQSFCIYSNINDNAKNMSMDGIRLISAHFAIFLLFIVFKKVTPKIDEISSNITPAIIENDINTFKVKSDRLRRKNYNLFRDVDDDHKEDDDIRLHIKRAEKNREPKIWDQWGNWSTCSVTCGIGKIVRWRHCISGRCSLGEKKAQLKTCTSAAC